MASTDPKKRANFLRIYNLLVDKGTEALRMCFDAILPPANLRAVLNANKELLQVLNPWQMDLLFPRLGNRPDSTTFDITLLSFLLRNICASLSPPTLGWDTEPLATDCNREADIVRIELFRNKIYARAVTPQIDNATFEEYWSKISDALHRLGIPAEEISNLKTCPLVHEDETTRENHNLGRHTTDRNTRESLGEREMISCKTNARACFPTLFFKRVSHW
ncbi:Hypothetical predicted protein [Paramuricea clavata]|uniref:Uncharacterized protein n=1 Tax=Paramuricea clavata TaxID=317549 RepID=A0A6S7IGW4_PARCT|nr:Hypothetical predicted protein [Paramuricea clavata]